MNCGGRKWERKILKLLFSGRNNHSLTWCFQPKKLNTRQLCSGTVWSAVSLDVAVLPIKHLHLPFHHGLRLWASNAVPQGHHLLQKPAHPSAAAWNTLPLPLSSCRTISLMLDPTSTTADQHTSSLLLRWQMLLEPREGHGWWKPDGEIKNMPRGLLMIHRSQLATWPWKIIINTLLQGFRSFLFHQYFRTAELFF